MLRIILAASLLLISGCSQTSSVENEYKPELSFEAETVFGDTYDFEQLEGKDTVLWFWTPWCAICAKESQDVAELQKEFPEVEFLGIAGQGSAAEMRQFVERTGTEGFTHLADTTGEIWANFSVPIQPSLVTVDSEGRPTLHVGPSTKSELRQRIQKLSLD